MLQHAWNNLQLLPSAVLSDTSNIDTCTQSGALGCSPLSQFAPAVVVAHWPFFSDDDDDDLGIQSKGKGQAHPFLLPSFLTKAKGRSKEARMETALAGGE